MRKQYVKRKLRDVFVSTVIVVLTLSPLYFTLPKLGWSNVSAAGAVPDSVNLVNIDSAKRSTEYLSNTVNLVNFTGTLTASVTGGTNTQLVKNGSSAGTSVSVTQNDSLAIRSTAPSADNQSSTITLKIGTYTTTWTIKTVPLPSPASVSGTQSGYTAGAFKVNTTGAATYQVPLFVAPGSGKLHPDLALAYSSQSGNGILGVGWSLSGLSTITRCPATLATDNFGDTVDFDGNDKYCLDGSRLIGISGSYGANGAEYRTETESFSRIISYGTSGDGPTSFKLWTKAGLIIQYGNTNDSRIEAQGKSSVLFWAVNRIQDTNNNYMTVSYTEDNANTQFYANRIDYTGNTSTGLAPYASVQFTYADRSDREQKFVEGSQLALTKRLATIRSLVGSSLIREYRLSYKQDPVTQRSELIQLQECGSDGVCLVATKFDWQGATSENFTFNGPGSAIWTGHDGGASNNFVGDFNGDGKSDQAKYTGPNGQWQIRLGNSTGFTDGGMWQGHAGGANNNVLGDFNADGRTDMMGYTGANGQWHLCFSTGSGFNCSFVQSHNSGVSNNAIGDFNGDGRSDMLKYADAPNVAKWRVWLSNGTSFTDGGTWDGHAGGAANNILGDFNGDGKTDIAGYSGSNGNWHVCLSTGTSWNCSFWTGHWGGQNNNVVADFNGDGKSDIAGYGGSNGNWDVCLSRGNGFACGYWQGHYGGVANNEIGDFNGDGRADMAGYTGSNGQWHVALSTGSNFNAPGSGLWSGNSGNATVTFIGDFNGDGKSDMSAYTGAGSGWHVTLPGGAFPDQLSKITNGHGLVININYKPLTDNTVYTKGSGATYARYDMQGPLYVVSSHNVSNGNGGTRSLSYKYQSGEMNLWGRGFRGFGKVIEKDDTSGTTVTTTYPLDYRYANSPTQIDTKLDNGTLVKQVVNTVDIKTFANNRYFAFNKTSVTKDYEINGSLIKTTTINNEYDDYGNPTKISVDHGSGYTEVTTNTFANTIDSSRWQLGRLTNASVTKAAPSQPSITKVTKFEYDGNGLLSKEEVEPSNSSLRLTKQYTRDSYGNITQTNRSGPNVSIRTDRDVYDSKGRFVSQSINQLNQTTAFSYDNLGNRTIVTDPNGLSIIRQYDSFGRLIRETSPAGVPTQLAYRLCGSCLSGGKYFIQKDTPGQPTVITYYDLLDRELRVRTTTLNGTFTNVDTQYDTLGRAVKRSEPTLEGATPLWTTIGYDKLDREVTSTAPGNRTTKYTYSGLTTTITNPRNQNTTLVINVLGETTQSKDANGATVNFVYDAFSNLIKTTDPVGNVTQQQFDIIGNKTKLIDPDLGTITYAYNPFGELVTQVDAKGQNQTFTYDGLGRLIKKQTSEGTTTWTFDIKPKAIGQLVKVAAPNGYSEDFNFDGSGRQIESVRRIDNTNYSVYSAFDQYGRIIRTTYPAGFSTKAIYNAANHLSEVRNNDNTLYWQANSMNARGQYQQATLGNGLITKQTFDANAGWLTTIKTGTSTSDSSVQSLAYTYDSVGNVTSRKDVARNITEAFIYDNLNRLTSHKVGSNTAIAVQYNSIGNITSKSDRGTYSYGAGKPHAVSAIASPTSTSYAYDANGNRTSGGGGTISYSVDNRPLVIKKGAANYTYQYAPDGSKIKSVLTDGSTTRTTIYVGDVYEKLTVGSTTTHINYVQVMGKPVVVSTKNNSGSTENKYLHLDSIGSPHVVTNNSKSVLETLSFDAWGNRRNGTTWLAATPTTYINKAYTGHEQLDKVALVHMTGRVYDPISARFTSADQYVQVPEFSQSYNRYSYVLNNPVTLTDPTGHNWFSDLWKGAIDFVKENWKSAVATGVGLVTGGIGGALFGAIGSAAGYGFGAAFAGSILNGGGIGDALRAGLINGVVAAFTAYSAGAIGDVFGHETTWRNITPKALAHGIVGGIVSKVRGGSFKAGFMSSAVNVISAPTVSTLKSTIDRVISSMVIGNSSQMNGGKFANGAVTAGFQRFFNDEQGKIKQTRDPNEHIKFPAYALRTYRDATVGTPGAVVHPGRYNAAYKFKIEPLGDFEALLLEGAGSFAAQQLMNMGRGPIVGWQSGLQTYGSQGYMSLDAMRLGNDAMVGQGLALRAYEQQQQEWKYMGGSGGGMPLSKAYEYEPLH